MLWKSSSLAVLQMNDERMTVVDARKVLQIMNDCCKGLVFTKKEVSQIATICLKAIEREESGDLNGM